MLEELIVHPRIMQRHPELSEQDVRDAWGNVFYEALRADTPNFPEYLWIGVDGKGREVEMVGTFCEQGWLVYHANTPVSKRVMHEISKRRK